MFGKPKPAPQRDIDPKLRRMQADATLHWWKKNLKWVILMGPVLTTITCVGGMIWGLYSVKNSSIYLAGLELVTSDVQVQQVLGQPVEAAFLAQGSEDGLEGIAVFNVKGPLGTAAVKFSATRENDASTTWTPTELRVYPQTEFTTDEITIFGSPPEPPAPSESLDGNSGMNPPD